MSVQDNIAAAYQAAFNRIFDNAVVWLAEGIPPVDVVSGFMLAYASLNQVQALVVAALVPPPAS